MREYTCAFTGHRPQSLPWGMDETAPRAVALKNRLKLAVELAMTLGYRRFLFGGAMGCDLYYAEAVLNAGGSLYAYLPYARHYSSWPHNQTERLCSILENCAAVQVLQTHYTDGCLLARNRAMVDASGYLIAVWNGARKGGTFFTINYAVKNGLTVDNLRF